MKGNKIYKSVTILNECYGKLMTNFNSITMNMNNFNEIISTKENISTQSIKEPFVLIYKTVNEMKDYFQKFYSNLSENLNCLVKFYFNLTIKRKKK
jgi:hypothetical protein